MSGRLAVLYETLAALEMAAARLQQTHQKVLEHFPLSAETWTMLDDNTQERFDAYAVRYARCQDLLYPAMRALARAQLEPRAERSFLDLFRLMQKQGIVTSIEDWERQRSLRNAVGHEYPDAAAVIDILNGIGAATEEILRYILKLTQKGEELGRGR